MSDFSISMNWVLLITPIVLPLKNAEIATAQAATLVWNNLARQVALRNSTSAQRAQAVILVYMIAWNKAVINHLAANRLNDIRTMMRRPFFPQEGIRPLRLLREGGLRGRRFLSAGNAGMAHHGGKSPTGYFLRMGRGASGVHTAGGVRNRPPF